MSTYTEIYMCCAGESLWDAKMEISYTITGQDEAARDARGRCRRNPLIERVAYFAIEEDKAPRNFYVYTKNPKLARRRDAAARAPADMEGAENPSWFARLRETFRG